jgi:hypothetical protein
MKKSAMKVKQTTTKSTASTSTAPASPGNGIIQDMGGTNACMAVSRGSRTPNRPNMLRTAIRT